MLRLYILPVLFSLAQQPDWSLGHPILEVSRSHTETRARTL